MADNFDVITGRTSASFAGAKEAGAAFFRAESSQRPYVVHTPAGGNALPIAGTTVLKPPGGEASFVKFLPAAEFHATSPDFRHGYIEAGRSASMRDDVNSIGTGDELGRSAASQVRIGQWPKSAPAPAAELMRLYVRDGSRYTLHMESDFQAAMKEAEVVYSGGKDVLINEKANPQLVHVKSNLYNDVNVGREISPAEQDGIYLKGKGEVLLASFYEKLPLVEQKAVDKSPAPDRQRLFPQREVGDGPAGPRPTAVAVAGPAATAKPAVVLDKGLEVDKDELQSPILKKAGYALPANVADAYTVKSGRFIDKASEKVHFEDHGKKLSTTLEDKTVIAHMVDVAAAKKWDRLDLTGTLNFRQMAWLETESRGIRTTGYEPTKQDLQQLALLKSERGVEPDKGMVNSLEVSTEREFRTREAAAERPSGSKTADENDRSLSPASTNEKARDEELKVLKSQAGYYVGTTVIEDGLEQPNSRISDYFAKSRDAQSFLTEALGAEEQRGAAAPPKADDRAKPIIGRLVEHGAANFNHDPDEKPSYFVTLDTDSGERKIWGKDLERSLSAGGFEMGDAIWLERQGYEHVTVGANVRDGSGKVVGQEEIAARRNVWDVKPADLAVIRTRPPEERVQVEAAYKVLEQETQQYPADVRRELVQRFADSVKKGEIKLPTPQVAEKAAQPETERGPAREPVTEAQIERGD